MMARLERRTTRRMDLRFNLSPHQRPSGGIIRFLNGAITGGMKLYGEASGSSQVEGRIKATAQEIANVLETRAEEEGWIK
jgi:hypothetical protein